jgi:hypothetical protein
VEGIFIEMWGLIIAEVVLLGISLIVDIKSLKGPKWTLI